MGLWLIFVVRGQTEVEGQVFEVQRRLGNDRQHLATKESGVFDWWVSSRVSRQGESE